MIMNKIALLVVAAGGAAAFITPSTRPSTAFSRTVSTKSRPPVVVFASASEDDESVLDRVASTVKSVADTAKDKIAELAETEQWAKDLEGLSKVLDDKARAAMAELDLSVTEEADFGKLVAAFEAKARDAVAAASAIASSDEVAQLKEASKVAGSKIQERAGEILERYGNNTDIQAVQQQATEEIVTILKNREYGIADLFYLLRLCTSFGLGMNPVVMSIFPLNVLIQLYNFSLIQEGGRGVLSAVALELDKRAKRVMTVEMDKQAKTALFGDPDAEVGTLFKKALLDAIGKSEYEFGDVAQNLIDAIEEKGGKDEDIPPAEELEIEPIGINVDAEDLEVLDAELVEELETIDEKLKTSAELDSL